MAIPDCNMDIAPAIDNNLCLFLEQANKWPLVPGPERNPGYHGTNTRTTLSRTTHSTRTDQQVIIVDWTQLRIPTRRRLKKHFKFGRNDCIDQYLA
uniref:Uncharacterized protein n=1 Tax=Romanomermis culicivorax TaxID=13658 RepID=A0A915L284_ROMCU